MCVIVFKQEGHVIEEKVLKAMWEQNPHGAGYMFTKNEKLIIVKGLMTFEKFIKAWKHHEELKAVLHFRIKTNGEINQENTHPFYIHKGEIAIAHNGSLTMDADFLNFCGIDKVNPAYSDTWHFANYALKKLPAKWWENNQILHLLQQAVKYNKFVIMNNHNEVTIINEKMGDWIDDKKVWVSNTSWRSNLYSKRENYNNSHRGHYKNTEYYSKLISLYKTVKTTEEKVWETEENEKVTIPKGTIGYVSEYLEYNQNTKTSYWWIKFDAPIAKEIKTSETILRTYKFPYAETTLEVVQPTNNFSGRTIHNANLS